jgi:DNA-binding NarL/FixJ family response regulator
VTEAGGTIRVAVVEDDAGLRESLRLLIGGTRGFTCTGTWGSAQDALDRLKREPAAAPDVILMDIHLPGLPGSQAVRLVRDACPSVAVLMLSVYEGEEEVFESLCNGAAGYLLKKTPPPRLMEAIREVKNGGAPMSPEIARKVIQLFREIMPPKPDHDLTPQEVRLLRLLADGASYQAAADRLQISINTVRNYVRSVYEKLHVNSKSAAVSKAMKSRII